MRSDLITTSLEVAHLSKVVRGLRPRADAAIAARDRAALGSILDDAEAILNRGPQLQKLAQVGTKAYNATMALCAHRARGNVEGVRAASAVLGGTISQWQKLTAPRPVSLGDLSELKRRRSNDLYATINAADASIKKARRALPTSIQHLAGLGAASYADTNRDCPVDASAEANWDNWCNCMYSGEENTRCKWRVSLGCPGCAFAPWTDVGAGARSIRKANAGILYTASNLTAVPSPSEYEPDALFRTSVENWPRFAVLAGYLAGLTSFANPLVAVVATIGVGVNPAAAITFWTTAPAIAIPYALIRGQGRLEQNVLGPLASLSGDVLKSVLQSLSGEPKAAAVAFFARRAAKTLESYPDDFSKSLGVFLRGIAETATEFTSIAADPKGRLSIPGTWNTIGTIIAQLGANAVNNVVGGTTVLIGEVMKLLSSSLADLVRGDGQAALNNSTTELLGARLDVLMKGGPALTNALSQENNAVGKLSNLEGGVSRLAKSLEHLTKEMKGVPMFGEAIKLITSLIDAVKGIFEWIKTFLSNAKKAPNQPQKQNTAAPLPKPKPSAGGIAAGAAGGALIGAKVAAVPGAIIGGTVGAVVAALTVKKPAPIVAPPTLTTARVTTAARPLLKVGVSTITNRRT